MLRACFSTVGWLHRRREVEGTYSRFDCMWSAFVVYLSKHAAAVAVAAVRTVHLLFIRDCTTFFTVASIARDQLSALSHPRSHLHLLLPRQSHSQGSSIHPLSQLDHLLHEPSQLQEQVRFGPSSPAFSSRESYLIHS